jgi:hypothetical protein
MDISIVGSERIQKLREPNNHGYKVALNNQNWDLVRSIYNVQVI